MSRWPVAGPSGYRLLACSPASEVRMWACFSRNVSIFPTHYKNLIPNTALLTVWCRLNHLGIIWGTSELRYGPTVELARHVNYASALWLSFKQSKWTLPSFLYPITSRNIHRFLNRRNIVFNVTPFSLTDIYQHFE